MQFLLRAVRSVRKSAKRAALGLSVLSLWASPAEAHDIRIPVETLRRDVRRVTETFELYRARPALPPLPVTREDHQLLLGHAEIELAVGNRRRALEILMGRLADPNFHKLPEYVDTLLLTSQLLEQSAEEVGALHYAARALAAGGTPEQMSEAGARWFRIARQHQRFEDRVQQYELWKKQGGEQAAGTELSAEVMYQVAFALRADRQLSEARDLLTRVPSESAFGSRAAYLAGVTFVEEGDLANAERWFAAIAGWPLPALPEGHPQLAIEAELRSLASLSLGRLLYEKGELDAAARAYRQVPEGSPQQVEACWELAYLDLERGVRRGALKSVQCVLDKGAAGSRHVDAQLFRASLHAHLQRYSASIEAYTILEQKIRGARDVYAAALADLTGPAEFLFDGMERNAMDQGDAAAPGPATLFADAWTPDVDRAYRVDRGMDVAGGDLSFVMAEVDALSGVLSREAPFVALQLRRHNLEQLLMEVRHLEGHAGELTQHRLSANADGTVHDHGEAADEVRELMRRLSLLGREVEDDITRLSAEEQERQTRALQMLSEIRGEARALAAELEAIEGESKVPIDAAARAALGEIEAYLSAAARRAEFGVLDTYWLKKEHRTQAIEALTRDHKDREAQVLDAIQELGED